ncbi:hypothetical protein PGN35_028900 [Nodosilinea sp. PGN35]|uniref:hypothetical protein n=1 Tax=Nodosilinea sp. PGN35 TaxID=3020489 RepID=UPI0023B30EAB|nr:hypothetical protein [Nodosilinea sp. TSF1-S3]MDF0365460.1 hypothetical protein [Nodosilinea sp. TSF1-S3]
MAQVKNGATAVAEVEAVAEEAATPEDAFASDDLESVDADQIDDLFKDLKTLLGTVEKLQKARQDVGDIKPLILRLLDGELLSGDELEELRGGIGGLSKILKLYNDYQSALERAQPARTILDQLLKS